MGDPAFAAMRSATILILVAVVILSAATLTLGLVAVMTGVNHLPRVLKRRLPGWEYDERRWGKSQIFMGAGGLVFAFWLLSIPLGWLAQYAHGEAGVFITFAPLAVYVACVIGAYVFGRGIMSPGGGGSRTTPSS